VFVKELDPKRRPKNRPFARPKELTPRAIKPWVSGSEGDRDKRQRGGDHDHLAKRPHLAQSSPTWLRGHSELAQASCLASGPRPSERAPDGPIVELLVDP